MIPNYRYGQAPFNQADKKRTEFTLGAAVTCTNANQVYDIGAPVASVGGSTLIDGSNLLAHTELIITQNDWTAPTGTNAPAHITLVRTNSNDGTATSSLSTADKVIIDHFGMDASSVVRIPLMEHMSLKKFKIACDVSGKTFNISIRGFYQAP